MRLDPWGRLLTKKRVGETVYFTKREDRMSKGTKGKCGLCSRNKSVWCEDGDGRLGSLMEGLKHPTSGQ